MVELTASAVGDDLHRLTVKITNRTPLAAAQDSSRDEALMRSLVSTHTILGVEDGEFISLTDPPEKCKSHAAQCNNIGAWPILVGHEPERDTMLSSPIILSDYPELAPESPGDLFDSTEIDEILTLRILTLTDEEKRAAAAVDDRVRQILIAALDATGSRSTDEPSRDASACARFRGPRFNRSRAMDDWNPFADDCNRPEKAGSRLRRRRRIESRRSTSASGRWAGADIMDIALDSGKTALIVGIEQDYEDRIHLAVTVDDDPGNDFGRTGQPGHRFFFGIDEVESRFPPAPNNESELKGETSMAKL